MTVSVSCSDGTNQDGAALLLALFHRVAESRAMVASGSDDQVRGDRLEDGVRGESLRVTPATHERAEREGAVRRLVQIGELQRV